MQNGSVYRDKKSGVWYVSFREAKQRVHERLSFARDCACNASIPCSECKKLAGFAAAKVAEKRITAPSSVGARCTLIEFWPTYKRDKEVELNPSTLKNYGFIWHRHVSPVLGDKRITAVTKQDCSELLRKIARDNSKLSRKTLQRIKAFMTALFNHAAEKWEMPPNPASGKLGKIGSTVEKKVVPYSPAEFDAFFAAVRKAALPAHHKQNAIALLTLMRATSLSRSELMGLHWEDLDFVNKQLKIRRGRAQDCNEARLKTRDRKRDQDLPEWAFQQLLLLRAATEGRADFSRRRARAAQCALFSARRVRTYFRMDRLARVSSLAARICDGPRREQCSNGHATGTHGATPRQQRYGSFLCPCDYRQQDLRVGPVGTAKAELSEWSDDGRKAISVRR
jgi:integrase